MYLVLKSKMNYLYIIELEFIKMSGYFYVNIIIILNESYIVDVENMMVFLILLWLDNFF